MISYPPYTTSDKSACHGTMHDGTFDDLRSSWECWSSCWPWPRSGGFLVQRLGQPAVLGELIGGVLVGESCLGLVNPDYETIHLLSELGVVILLFAIGLETDLGQLFKVGATSLTVAVVGVALPFVLGFAACRAPGLSRPGVDHGGGDLDGHERGDHGPRALRPGPAA